MIGEIYVPSHYLSTDEDPSKSAEEKLEVITNSTPKVTENRLGAFRVTLPYVWGASAEPLVRDPNILYLHHLNVGDAELYNRGIGTRLLQATIRYGALKNSNLTSVLAIDADLGLVNTLAKCLGEENLRASLSSHDHYGFGSDHSLESMLINNPPKDGEPYQVWEVEAQIDPELVKTWELPTAETTGR